MTDAPYETFHTVLDNLRAGEQLIVVRVYDTANNAGLAKVVVRQQIAPKNYTSQIIDCVWVAGAGRPARTTT